MAGPRSVFQRAKDRTNDVDAAVDAMSKGNAPPKIGGAIAPGARAPAKKAVAKPGLMEQVGNAIGLGKKKK